MKSTSHWHQSLHLLLFDIHSFYNRVRLLNKSFSFGRDRESDRESRIRERREEQDKKKEEQKLVKKAARERQLIEQGKKGWWKDFNWCVGVMVEMEWDDEWWDAVVIQVLPSQVHHASNAEGDSVLQGEPPVLISLPRETGLDAPFPALPVGLAVDDNGAACKDSIDIQDGDSRKPDEAAMVKKCQVIIDCFPIDFETYAYFHVHHRLV